METTKSNNVSKLVKKIANDVDWHEASPKMKCRAGLITRSYVAIGVGSNQHGLTIGNIISYSRQSSNHNARVRVNVSGSWIEVMNSNVSNTAQKYRAVYKDGILKVYRNTSLLYSNSNYKPPNRSHTISLGNRGGGFNFVILRLKRGDINRKS